MMSEPQSLEELHEIISNLARTHFYGQLLLNFESGLIVTLKKTESIKLTNHNQFRNNRKELNHEHSSRS